MLSENDIDMGLLDESEPVVLAHGGSESTGYKNSEYYDVELYYVLSEDMFLLSKSTINGVRTWSFMSISASIKRYNRLCEDSYKDKSVTDEYDVPEYVLEEVNG